MSTNRGNNTFAPSTRGSDVTTIPNFEQSAGRTVIFAGDYLGISPVGNVRILRLDGLAGHGRRR